MGWEDRMFALRNFVAAVAAILDIGLTLYRITEPALRRIRKAMPFLMQAGLDLTPIVLFLIIYFLRRFLVATIYDAAARMG
jgi:YggT family protein